MNSQTYDDKRYKKDEDSNKPSLREQDLGVLLEDLLHIKNNSEFGKKFEILLAKPEHFDQLIFRVFRGRQKEIRIPVMFYDYPATYVKFLAVTDDIENSRVSNIASKSLVEIANWRRLVLPDVLMAILEAVKQVDPTFSTDYSDYETRSNVRNNKNKDNYKSANRPNIFVSFFQDIFGMSSDFSDNAEQEYKSNNTYNELHDLPVSQIIWNESLYKQILKDFSRHNPREYAFICSGILYSNGEAHINNYYPGVMKISTPTYCELTDKFIETTIYETIPANHTLIVWGHVHPIQGPSGTDEESFREIIRWDKEIAKHGFYKRSIGLLINTHQKNPLFFDLHSSKHIHHTFVRK